MLPHQQARHEHFDDPYSSKQEGRRPYHRYKHHYRHKRNHNHRISSRSQTYYHYNVPSQQPPYYNYNAQQQYITHHIPPQQPIYHQQPPQTQTSSITLSRSVSVWTIPLGLEYNGNAPVLIRQIEANTPIKILPTSQTNGYHYVTYPIQGWANIQTSLATTHECKVKPNDNSMSVDSENDNITKFGILALHCLHFDVCSSTKSTRSESKQRDIG